MAWKFIPVKAKIPKLNSPILIEGLPGIGNVGKVAADFIIDEIKAKKIFEIFSNDLPNSVFVNEKNLVELPTIEIYYKRLNSGGKGKGRDLIILTGDVQPTYEASCYEFCEAVLDKFQEMSGSEIITLGGIGLSQIPKKPSVYCTGNNQKTVAKYKKGTKINGELYGVVGPIVGVSGLLLGLAEKRNIPAISLLAETLGHPAYLGVSGAKEIIKVLDKKLSLRIKMKKLEKEIDDLEEELGKVLEASAIAKKSSKLKKFQSLSKETNYIG
ncbi:MAG: PAC2 family protein [Nanoarchaeota archaeon]|nr:PAC2 family protein [Nanoarchaeota archaeon]